MSAATVRQIPKSPSRTMGELDRLRIVITVAVAGIILLLTYAITLLGGPYAGLATLIIPSVLFLVTSFVYGDAGRYIKVLPKIRGVFVNELLGPGYVYLPLKTIFPFLLSYEFRDGGEVEFDFTTEERLRSNQQAISLGNQFYLMPDPHNPVKLNEIGGFAKACERLRGQIGQRERDWILSTTEGPQSLDEARGMKDEAIHMILRMLLEDDLRRLAPGISEEVILGFIKHRPPTTAEQIMMTQTLEQKDPAEREAILADGRELLELIQKTRTGEISIALHNLGVIVTRFGVDEIKGVGATAAGQDEIAKANLEAEKRKVVATGYRDAAKVIADSPGFKGDSMQTMLIAEGVVKKEVKETEIGVSDPLIETGKILLEPIAAAIAAKIAGK